MNGEIFRKIRVEKKLTQTFVANGQISIASLSRFEAGKISLPIDVLHTLLQRMDISLLEYITMIDAQSGCSTSFDSKVSKAYNDRETSDLAKMYGNVIRDYRQTRRLSSLFDAATIASAYYDLSGTILLKQIDLEIIGTELLSCSYWTRSDIGRFANVAALLTISQLDAIASTILEQLTQIRKRNFTNYQSSLNALLNALLNAAYILLSKNTAKSIQSAIRILSKLNSSLIPEHLLFTRLRLYFYSESAEYLMGNHSHSVNLESVIEFLGVIHSDCLAREFTDTYQNFSSQSQNTAKL